jgi:hypothetical protein
MQRFIEDIHRERQQLRHQVAQYETTIAVREQRFQSAFVAWLAISLGAAMVVMAACVIGGAVSGSALMERVAVPALLLGLFNVVVGYRRLPPSLK